MREIARSKHNAGIQLGSSHLTVSSGSSTARAEQRRLLSRFQLAGAPSEETAGFDLYRAHSGQNAGANLNDPGDDRPARLPDRRELNVEVRANLLPLLGLRIVAPAPGIACDS